MTETIVLGQENEWSRLKALVLDSVSSPITQTRLQHGAQRGFRVVPAGTEARLQRSDRRRVAVMARGPRAWIILDHRADAGHPEDGDGAEGQRPNRSRLLPVSNA